MGVLALHSGFRSTLSSWNFRQGKLSQALNKPHDSYDFFQESIEFNPDNTKAHYESLIVSLVKMGDSKLAKKHVDYLNLNHPHAGDFQRLKSTYYEMKARKGSTEKAQFLKLSLDSLEIACSHNVTDLNSYVQRVEFATKYMSLEKSVYYYSELQNLYKFKFEKLMKYWRRNQSEIVEEWVQSKSFGERLKQSQLLLSGLKYSQLSSFLFPEKYNSAKAFSLEICLWQICTLQMTHIN